MTDVLENTGQLAIILLLKSSNFWKFDKVQNDNQNLTKQKRKVTFKTIVRQRSMLHICTSLMPFYCHASKI